jgi:uncharacterized integral membrane protein (TIGR00698 family)
VTPPKWNTFAQLQQYFAQSWYWYLILYAVFTCLYTASAAILGYKTLSYFWGFTVVFILSLFILIAGSWNSASNYGLEAPLIALIVGLVFGNIGSLPAWLHSAFRTEYYIKTGIVLLGATLPLTLIITAGPIAFLQATIVSVTTFSIIFFVSVKYFDLDKRFAAVLGGAGSVCGVSAAIAIGGAVEAKKEHVSIGISIVSLWAVVWIFVLPVVCKYLGLSPAVSGAWIGTSEFADAAGFAASAAIGDETAIRTFTLMKVIGRDIWIGLWAFSLSFLASYYWDKKDNAVLTYKPSPTDIWLCFPKFVLGFFAACLLLSFVSASISDVTLQKSLQANVIGPIKDLRTWTFVFAFFCIGITTRFKELGQFGWGPFWAFTAGVIVNVPLGYILSVLVFGDYWSRI